MQLITRLVRRTDGQDLIEYALLASAISLSVLLVLGPIGTSLSNSYQSIGSGMSGPASGGNSGGGNGNGNGRGNGGNNGRGNGGGNNGGGNGGGGNNGRGNAGS